MVWFMAYLYGLWCGLWYVLWYGLWHTCMVYGVVYGMVYGMVYGIPVWFRHNELGVLHFFSVLEHYQYSPPLLPPAGVQTQYIYHID